MRISSRKLIAATLAASALAVAGVAAVAVAGPAATTSGVKRVAVRDNFFSPKAVRIGRGQSVRWTWRGSEPHNVVFRKTPRGAKPKRCGTTRRRGASCTRKFRKRGTYRYVCTIHELAGMTGRVVVR